MFNGAEIKLKKNGNSRIFWLFKDGDYVELIKGRWEDTKTFLSFTQLYKILVEDGYKEA